MYKNTREGKAELGPVEDTNIALKAAREISGRRKWQYDLPSAQVIDVLMAWDGTATTTRDIIIRCRHAHLESVTETHPV